jgi:hypothetical protein
VKTTADQRAGDDRNAMGLTTARIMFTGSGSLFHQAVLSARATTPGDHRGVTAVVMAFVALECWVNEIGEFASWEVNHSPGAAKLAGFAPCWATAEKAKQPTVTKLDLLHEVVHGVALDRGVQPFQDLCLLQTLRNSIVHMKADSFEPGVRPEDRPWPKVALQVAARTKIDLTQQPTCDVLSLIARPEVARWACHTVAAVLEAMVPSPESDLAYFTWQIRAHARDLGPA